MNYKDFFSDNCERVTDADYRSWIDEELWCVADEPDDYQINEVYEKLAVLEDAIDNGDVIITPRSKWLLMRWVNNSDGDFYFVVESCPYLFCAGDKWYPTVDINSKNDASAVVAVFDSEEEAEETRRVLMGA